MSFGRKTKDFMSFGRESKDFMSFGRKSKDFYEFWQDAGAGPCIFALKKPARGGPETAKNPLRGQEEEKPGREKRKQGRPLCYAILHSILYNMARYSIV